MSVNLRRIDNNLGTVLVLLWLTHDLFEALLSLHRKKKKKQKQGKCNIHNVIFHIFGRLMLEVMDATFIMCLPSIFKPLLKLFQN